MKISFVVPIYNVAQYLSRCLDSILASGLKEDQYEVVLVNDGSTDSSAAIARKYCDDYENISMVSQANQGLSAARNTGLKYVTGDYVWFPDSDDYLVSENIKKVCDRLTANEGLDILVTCCNVIEGESCRRGDYYPQFQKGVMTGRDAVLGGYMPSAVWVMVYRIDFFRKNNLSFYYGISREDVEFNLRAMALAGKVLFTDIVTYNYIKRAGTLSVPTSREKLYFNYHSDLTVSISHSKFSRKLDDKALANNILRRSNTQLVGMLLTLKWSKNPHIDRSFKEQLLDEMTANDCYPVKGPFLSWKMSLLSKLLNCRRFILS